MVAENSSSTRESSLFLVTSPGPRFHPKKNKALCPGLQPPPASLGCRCGEDWPTWETDLTRVLPS